VIDTFKAIEYDPFLVIFERHINENSRRNVELWVEIKMLLRVKFKPRSVMIHIRQCVKSSRRDLVFLIPLPPKLHIQQIVKAEVVMIVLNKTVGAGVRPDARLVRGHGHCLHKVGFSCTYCGK